MAFAELKIRSFDREIDTQRIEDFERSCEIGPAENVFLFTDTMGDPICRIRNSPQYKMLVAELDHELVGVIQGSIKVVTVKEQARVGYVLGLRVAPRHRRKAIGLSLVKRLEDWFVANHVDFAYMATDKDNHASVKLFTDKLGYIRFRTPAILVNPVGMRRIRIAPTVEITKLKIEDAERLYRLFMGSTEFFPNDIDRVLGNKLSLGTWVACPRGESMINPGQRFPTNWAMVSVWNSGDLFKLRVGKAPLSCHMYAKGSRLIDQAFPCLKIPVFPDVFRPFGFYFMYGLHQEGPRSGGLVRSLCRFVHDLAMEMEEDCKVIVTEVGGCDTLRLHIPHWKKLSCAEDFWCIKALRKEAQHRLFELTQTPDSKALFVDPREV